MKKLCFFVVSLICLGCKSKHQNIGILVNEIPNKSAIINSDSIKLDTLNVDFQIRSNCFAYSSDKNKKSSNGEAQSDNLPKMADDNFPKGVYLTLNQKENTRIDSVMAAYKLYFVNKTDKSIIMSASDERICILAEALNDFYQWQPITFLPHSGCGNSWHEVVLDKNEYWDFNVPIFKGNYKTKMRYVVYIDKKTCIYSNEIDVSINKLQFDKSRQQAYKSYNLMNPEMEVIETK